MSFARTPEPPYYAVIFTSVKPPKSLKDGDDGYAAMSEALLREVSGLPGFLGVESVRDAGGLGITVSYWESLEAIRRWREHALHRIAQERGRRQWYRQYALRVCRVERHNYFEVEGD